MLITLFLFFASRGLYPCMSFNVIDLLDIITCKSINKKKIIDIFEIIQSIYKYAQESLTENIDYLV